MPYFLHQLIKADGSVIFETNSKKDIQKMLCDYLETHHDEFIIEIDNRQHPVSAYPFTTWIKSHREFRGDVFKTQFDALMFGNKTKK